MRQIIKFRKYIRLDQSIRLSNRSKVKMDGRNKDTRCVSHRLVRRVYKINQNESIRVINVVKIKLAGRKKIQKKKKKKDTIQQLILSAKYQNSEKNERCTINNNTYNRLKLSKPI